MGKWSQSFKRLGKEGGRGKEGGEERRGGGLITFSIAIFNIQYQYV